MSNIPNVALDVSGVTVESAYSKTMFMIFHSLFGMNYRTRFFVKTIRSMSTSLGSNPVESLVRSKLQNALSPTFLEIVNESYKHSVPKGSESHFKVVVVSAAFEGKTLVQMHRLVNQTLAEELKESIHALSIQAKTPKQWEQDATIANTPNCLGKEKHGTKDVKL